MTISSETRKAGPFPGNGATTAFPFAFKVFVAADLSVTLNVIATGVQTPLTLISDYTVALNPDQNANPGGTVTYNPSGVPMPSTKTLTIGSVLTNTQGYEPTNSGGWLPDNAENAWDRAVILIQQTVERLTRSLKFPIVDGVLNAELPAAAQRANKVLGFDGNGAVATYSASSAVTDAGSVNYVPVSGPTAGISVTVQTWLDRLLTAGASLGAALVGYLQAGVGAVSRAVQDKLRDTVSVRDFISTAIDGTTSNQTGIAAAVAAAYTAGARLYWPVGTYVSTATIPNFHDVEHFGPGIVKRGAETYTITGRNSEVNKLYITTTGSASNDGLSSTEPMATLAQAFAAIANVPQPVNQAFEIYHAAGTYGGGAAISFTTPTLEYVKVFGASVGGHPNVPTTIYDGLAGAGGGNYSHGIFAQGDGVKLWVQDIKGVNYNGDPAASTRGFFVADRGVDGYAKNMHVTAASWFGFYASSSFFGRVDGGIYDGCRNNILTDNARCSVGINGTTTTNRPILKNATETAVYWSRGTQGHIDYCDIQDNAVGAMVAEGARCDAVDLNFKRNTVAVRTKTGGMFGDNPALPCAFNVGGVDANTIDVQSYATSSDYNRTYLDARAESRIAHDRAPGTHTGVTGDTLFKTLATLPEGFMKDGQQKIRIKIYGVVTSAATAPILHLRAAGVDTATIAFPAAVNAGTAFEAEFEMMSNGPGNHRVTQKIVSNLVAPRMSSQALTFNFTTAAPLIQLYCNLANVADSLALTRVEVFAMG